MTIRKCNYRIEQATDSRAFNWQSINGSLDRLRGFSEPEMIENDDRFNFALLSLWQSWRTLNYPLIDDPSGPEVSTDLEIN